MTPYYEHAGITIYHGKRKSALRLDRMFAKKDPPSAKIVVNKKTAPERKQSWWAPFASDRALPHACFYAAAHARHEEQMRLNQPNYTRVDNLGQIGMR